MSRRYRAMTGQPLAYVIGAMWEGGNIAHYAPEHPRVLIDGSPARSPWIDLGDLRARGAIVIWPAGDPNVLPPSYRAIAEDAEIQPGFTLPMHRQRANVLHSAGRCCGRGRWLRAGRQLSAARAVQVSHDASSTPAP